MQKKVWVYDTIWKVSDVFFSFFLFWFHSGRARHLPGARLTFGWMDGFALECNVFFYFQEEWDFCLFFGLGDPGNCK